MEVNKLENTDLGLSLAYFEGVKKKERVFVANDIMKQLGYKGALATLNHAELNLGVDFVKVSKKDYPKFFAQLTRMGIVGHRAGSIIMLYESGVWKLVLRSRKQIGIKTRNWLASEVLPSIRRSGKYDVSESVNNPFSYLHEFTETKKQLDNSKKVALKARNEGLSYSKTYNDIHKLVLNKDAKEIKEMFKTKGSAREALRKYLPEIAATESFIDEVFTKYGKSIEEIERTNAHKTLPPAFMSIYQLGVKID